MSIISTYLAIGFIVSLIFLVGWILDSAIILRSYKREKRELFCSALQSYLYAALLTILLWPLIVFVLIFTLLCHNPEKY